MALFLSKVVLVSRRIARHGVNLLLGDENSFLVKLFFNSKVRLTMFGMVFSKFFDFFFKSLEEKFSTNFFLPG